MDQVITTFLPAVCFWLPSALNVLRNLTGNHAVWNSCLEKLVKSEMFINYILI